MINREVIYERNMTGSFMKIPAGMETGIDERLILRRKLPGALPVEKAYVDGGGQYWYNISGKQSLDTYCRVKDVGMGFVELLILSICSQLERLEWNLLRTECLMLDPELIFVSNVERQFLFTLYPGGNQAVEQEFQILMEYLMKRVDHKDAQAVSAVYRIYELTLKQGYQITDIRSVLMKEKNVTKESMIYEPGNQSLLKVAEDKYDIQVPKSSKSNEKNLEAVQKPKKESVLNLVNAKLTEWGIIQEVKKKDSRRKRYAGREKSSVIKESIPDIIYPDEEVEIKEESVPTIHPTVCLSGFNGQPRGELRYTGSEGLSDIQLKEESIRIGYGGDADISIDRETISQFHARIYKEEDGFYIEDLNSTNGTYVNEEPLAYKEQRKLMCNDIVQFADIRYRFC